jgi:3',5'-cyclic AMP phosphodiesterase CpdA
MLEEGLGAQEGASEIDGHHPIPIFHFDVRNRVVDRDAAVVNQDFHRTETVEGCLRHRLDLGFVLDIRLNG